MPIKTDNIILDKSKAFAIRIVNLYKYLYKNDDPLMREYVMSKQILRSGTSIGANAREARRAQSTPDFITKLYIALKEADETSYWLELLHETGFITDEMFESVYADCEELLKLLTSIIKTTQENTKK
ncbi:MAG: four helix bundle protein [Paludibacteraceae bacterium]|nr:four helix bundle protein [Paludibacteraceae bacterium]